MKKETTIQKGDSFEKQVYDLLKELLENNELYLNGKRSNIFWKKSYLSEKTNNLVEVDISIESYVKNADSYSQLTVIECKNYKSSVSINDIRELASVLNEIGEHNTKGLLITNSSFQKGTIDFAISTKIGLAKINKDNEIDWINYRKDKRYHSYSKAESEYILSNNAIQDKNFFAFCNKQGFERLPELLIELGIIDKYVNSSKYIVIPYKTKEEIEKITISISEDSVKNFDSLNTEFICSKLADTYGVEFNFNESLSNEILGKISFDPLRIYITQSLLSNTHRWRFTLAHEIGHLILHRELLNTYINENIDSDFSLSLNQTDSISYNKRLEIQANIFASYLLLPQKQLIMIVNDYFQKVNNYKGHLFLDNQTVNKSLVFNLLRELQNYFEVSQEVAKYRLIGLGLLKDTTDVSLNGILKGGH